MKKRDIITLAILILIFGIIILFMIINKKPEEKNIQEQTEFNKLSPIKDESIFFSIEKNINKIFEYANTEQTALNFIIKDEVDEKNYENMSFQTEEIYVVSKLNLYKYYVKGNVYKEYVDTQAEYIRKEYLILNYDMSTSSYNVEIINENRYNKAPEEEYIFENININNYNKFEYSNLSPKTRAIIYFYDFIDKIYTNLEDAYKLISEDTKQQYFENQEKLKEFVNINDDITLIEYSVADNQIGIKDNYGNEYIFEINGILKYKVTIILTEE